MEPYTHYYITKTHLRTSLHTTDILVWYVVKDIFVRNIVINCCCYYLFCIISLHLATWYTKISFRYNNSSTSTLDSLCACIVTTDLILTELISALNVLHKYT